MGRLEERIVESLTALRDEEPGGGRPMFVFPLSLMATVVGLEGEGVEIVRRGDALMVRRPEDS